MSGNCACRCWMIESFIQFLNPKHSPGSLLYGKGSKKLRNVVYNRLSTSRYHAPKQIRDSVTVQNMKQWKMFWPPIDTNNLVTNKHTFRKTLKRINALVYLDQECNTFQMFVLFLLFIRYGDLHFPQICLHKYGEAVVILLFRSGCRNRKMKWWNKKR